ncbi:hypothetical protein F5Y07DRAFT_403882 [Xylaria sp. FL0933]|nr:hypothetical protein F5Y07DRAFT_403882 [Xylaria sp. FL0933]
MARGKQRSNRRPTQRSTHQHHDPAIVAAQKEAERREKIIADTRRTTAKWRPKIPEVRKCNFENFKNRFHGLNEKDYAIDVLGLDTFPNPSLQSLLNLSCLDHLG